MDYAREIKWRVQMLVLTRRSQSGEQSTICIGQGIEITVLEVRGDQVRLGVDAPRSVSVHRTEIWLQLEVEALAAGELN